MLPELEEDVRHIVHEWFGKDAWVCETAGFERAQLAQSGREPSAILRMSAGARGMRHA